MLEFSAPQLLHARAASIRAVREGEKNAYSRACNALRRVADAVGCPFALVGGLAAIHYGAQVTALEIEIAVARNRLETVLAECEKQGFVLLRRDHDGWHSLTYQDPEGNVQIQIIPEGAKYPRDPPHAPANPGPRALGVEHGLGYSSFGGWVAMKLVANRRKDQYHLVEVLKLATEQQIAEAVQQLRPMHPSYLKAFDDLLREAAEENEQETLRRRHNHAP